MLRTKKKKKKWICQQGQSSTETSNSNNVLRLLKSPTKRDKKYQPNQSIIWLSISIISHCEVQNIIKKKKKLLFNSENQHKRVI